MYRRQIYMGVVFHFYNSDDEREESENEEDTVTKNIKQSKQTHSTEVSLFALHEYGCFVFIKYNGN